MKTHLQEAKALGRIVELVRELREKCPWDAKQTPATLRPYLVEEALELDHAISQDDSESIRVELGDLMLHIAYQIVLAEERGDFGAEDVTKTIEQKMKRRHPHIYGDEAAPASWERQKIKETDRDSSVLDGLPPTLPPILMACRLQERAAGMGFDWPDGSGPHQKLNEELAELDDAILAEDRDHVASELGDVLFSVINLVRKLDYDPREILEKANSKFADRFRRLEKRALEKGIDVGRADLDTLEEIWSEVKADQG